MYFICVNFKVGTKKFSTAYILCRLSLWLHLPFHDNWRLLQSGQWKSKLDRCWTAMSITT